MHPQQQCQADMGKIMIYYCLYFAIVIPYDYFICP